MSAPVPSPQTPAPRSIGFAWLTAFFLSGAVALIYQVLWTRQLGLVFGVTIQAASTVLACFMGGLALGSYVAGRWSDRLARPMCAFAWVEAAIAGAALLTPAALSAADALFVQLTPTLEATPALTTVVRIGLSALVLLVPATLMGTTYPLVLRAASPTRDGVRHNASLLYAVNTTGAIRRGSLWQPLACADGRDAGQFLHRGRAQFPRSSWGPTSVETRNCGPIPARGPCCAMTNR